MNISRQHTTTFITDSNVIYFGLSRWLLCILIGIILCFDCFCIYIINRTVRTPKNTKFLASWLVAFDGLSIVCVFIKIFVTGNVGTAVRSIGFVCVCFGYMSVCLMCIDRYIMFSNPMRYIRYFRRTLFKKMAVFSWICLLILLILLPVASCREQLVHVELDDGCLLVAGKGFGFVSFATNFVAVACYFQIFRIIRAKSKNTATTLVDLSNVSTNAHRNENADAKKNNLRCKNDTLAQRGSVTSRETCEELDGQSKSLQDILDTDTPKICRCTSKHMTATSVGTDGRKAYRPDISDHSTGMTSSVKTSRAKSLKFVAPLHSKSQNASTYLTFVYLVTTTTSTLIFLTWYAVGNESALLIRVLYDGVYILCAVIDPCVYIIWFKECRLEMLKLLSKCRPSLQTKVDDMRIEIFDIVTRPGRDGHNAQHRNVQELM